MRNTVLALASVLLMAPAPALAQAICEIDDPYCDDGSGPVTPEAPVYETQTDCQQAISDNRRQARGEVRGPLRCVLTEDGYVIE